MLDCVQTRKQCARYMRHVMLDAKLSGARWVVNAFIHIKYKTILVFQKFHPQVLL